MANKFDPDDLRAPDTFHTLSEKLFRAIEANAKVIAIVIAVSLFGGLGYITYGFFMNRAERIAGEDLYRPLEELKTAPAGKKEVSATAEQISMVDSALHRRAGTKVAAVVAMEAAEVLFKQNKFNEALALLKIPTYHFAKSDVMASLFALHRGLAELETSQTDAAIQTFGEVAESGSPKEFRAEALVKLGLSFEQKKDVVKAREAFDRVTREYPNGEAAAAAQLNLRGLDLKSRTGS